MAFTENRHKRMPALLLALLVLILTSPALSADTLRAGVEPWIPWIIKDKGQFTGIAVEICQQAVQRAGHRLVVMEIPTKRRDLVEWGRSVNIEPGCEMQWRVPQEAVSVYTEPYMETRNVIVSWKGSFPLTRQLTTFYGSLIGANTGYYYTDGLNQAFEQGLIIRDDCGSGHQLFSKLQRKRFSAIVADTLEWKYWMRELGQPIDDFQETYTFSHTNKLRIRLHRGKADLVEALNRALESMKSDHTIEAIVRRYIP